MHEAAAGREHARDLGDRAPLDIRAAGVNRVEDAEAEHAAARAIADRQPFGARRRNPRVAMAPAQQRERAQRWVGVHRARRDRGRQPAPQRAGACAQLEHGACIFADGKPREHVAGDPRQQV